MKKIAVLGIYLIFFLISKAQSPDHTNSINHAQNQNDSIRKIIRDRYNPQTFEGILSTQFSPARNSGDRWAYYAESGDIRLFTKPEVSKLIPHVLFYSARLTNYLGYHVNSTRCLVLFDTIHRKVFLSEPLWYSDQSEDLLKKFIGARFNDSISLRKFIVELQEIMLIGSSASFENTRYGQTRVSFDLVFSANEKTDIWRTFEIDFDEEHAIISFTIINPRGNESRVVK